MLFFSIILFSVRNVTPDIIKKCNFITFSLILAAVLIKTTRGWQSPFILQSCSLTLCPPGLSYIWSTQPWKQKGFLRDRGERVCLDSQSARHRTSSWGAMQEKWRLQTHTHTNTAGAKWWCIREEVLVKWWWMVEGGVTWQQQRQNGTERTQRPGDCLQPDLLQITLIHFKSMTHCLSVRLSVHVCARNVSAEMMQFAQSWEESYELIFSLVES